MMKTHHIIFLTIITAFLTGMLGGYIVAPEHEVVERVENHFSYTLQDGYNTTYFQTFYNNHKQSVAHIKVYKVVDGERRTSQGTGFVIREDGVLATNEHVVQDAQHIEVKMMDNEWYTAEILGIDTYSDLAVLEIDETGLQVLDIAENNPEPGTVVKALGSPLGLEGTITQGIVSGVNRTIRTEGRTIPDAVQTDASIDPGNSGGPLLGDTGEVVGINTAKRGENIGFAISPALLNRILPKLIEEGEYRHPYLGVNTFQVTPSVAERNNVDTEGVMVVNVEPEGPSSNVLRGASRIHRSSLMTVPIGGDIILEAEGTEILNEQDLNSFLVRNKSPGEEVEFKVLRRGLTGYRETKVTVELGERPRGEETAGIALRS